MTSQFGILLLHFGHTASRTSVIDAAPLWEAKGINSVWTRDHLQFQPHGFEQPSTVFMEPFTTLAAIGAITEKLILGTATTIPFRHPLVVSQLYGGLAGIVGGARIIAGIGAGAPKKPFDATKVPYESRFDAVKELAEILRLTWTTPSASYKGSLYEFTDVTIDPHPDPATPIWYGGSTPASVRRALEYCDGWFPGRCPLKTFDKYLTRVREGAITESKRMGVGIIPCLSVGRTREEALKAVNIDGLLEEARSRKFWVGPFDTADDLDGLLIAGTPSECAGQISRFVERGVDQIVFDFRLRPDDFPAQIELLTEEILPQVRAAAAGSAGTASA